MAETMVERVARALDEEMYGGKSFGPAPVPDSPGGEVAREHDRSKLLRWARAAIEAMREPTEEMIEAGLGHVTRRDIFNAMIDAILKEEGNG